MTTPTEYERLEEMVRRGDAAEAADEWREHADRAEADLERLRRERDREEAARCSAVDRAERAAADLEQLLEAVRLFDSTTGEQDGGSYVLLRATADAIENRRKRDG